ncbi:hypothetical protein T492DRAFT_882601, partial [Pavlovales sp. CCMP2436]
EEWLRFGALVVALAAYVTPKRTIVELNNITATGPSALLIWGLWVFAMGLHMYQFDIEAGVDL